MKTRYIFLAIFTLCFSQILRAQDDRPNIIFILTDDQPYSLLNYTENKIVQTPNIDKLANEGIFFSNARVSSAICKPSRTCILTGQYERAHGVNFNSGTALSAQAWQRCYPNLLKASGYYTGYIGKNHTPIGKDGYKTGLMESSYDYWYGSHGHIRFYPKDFHEIYKGAKANTQVEILEESVMDFLNPNERNLKGAMHFLDKRPNSKPFFLNICFNLPHGSSTSTMRLKDSDPETYRTLYRDKEILPPENYIARADIKTPKLPPEVLHAKDRQTGYNYVDTPETLRERNIREMQAVTGIDALIGKLVEELKAQGLDKNTVIIYSSDHGILNGQYGLGGKSLCYEYCTKVPFIIYDPRLPKDKISKDNDELVMSVDIPATILDYAKVQKPSSYQGHSLIPMIKGEQKFVREYAYTENLWSNAFGNPRCESVQDKNWKYIRYYKNENVSAVDIINSAKEMGLPTMVVYEQNTRSMLVYRTYRLAGINGEEPVYEELYNIKTDPYEKYNVINEPKNKEVLDNLRAQWAGQMKMVMGDELPKVDIIVE